MALLFLFFFLFLFFVFFFGRERDGKTSEISIVKERFPPSKKKDSSATGAGAKEPVRCGRKLAVCQLDYEENIGTNGIE